MNDRRPVLSIGMPVYNGAQCVGEAIRSLLAQSFSDFELIVSDNASTDSTARICEEIAASDPRVRVVRNPQNLGAAANFQRTLDEARGEYFSWAAYDDLWDHDYLRQALEAIRDSELSFVFPSFRLSSRRFPISKKIDAELFAFVTSEDRRERVLSFISLHHTSHKCNLVYSMFRADVLRSAIKMQSIADDGALACVILGLGRGKVIRGHMFNKRYEGLWPGALDWYSALWRRKNSQTFEGAKQKSAERLIKLFPEYRSDIEEVFGRYPEFLCTSGYRI